MKKSIKKYQISVLGCGWYGFELASKLSRLGHTVKGSTTSAYKLPLLAEQHITPYLINLMEDVMSFDGDFFNTEILIVTLPPKRAAGEQHTFTSKIKLIRDIALLHGIQHVIFTSSVSVYGDVNRDMDESAIPQPATDSGRAVLAAEDLFKDRTEFTTTVLRFGGLIGPGRDPGRFFSGKKNIPNGQAPINLIHLEDCIGITLKILEKEAFGNTFNACNPHHPQKQHFYVRAAANSGLTIPEFVDELKNWKIISGKRTAELLGYTYRISDWNVWLESGYRDIKIY